MASPLLTSDRLAIESDLLDALTTANVVDVVSWLEDGGRTIVVEQIGLQLADGTTLYLCPEDPVLVTTPPHDAEGDETDIFDPRAWHRCRHIDDKTQEGS